ncbi:hypothetical protein CAC01_28720 [Streptomyces sp. CLI2509]|nr:hypothetical protein CAC01_28720 [Streptomyces sp. CLI2509]
MMSMATKSAERGGGPRAGSGAGAGGRRHGGGGGRGRPGAGADERWCARCAVRSCSVTGSGGFRRRCTRRSRA